MSIVRHYKKDREKKKKKFKKQSMKSLKVEVVGREYTERAKEYFQSEV